MSSHQSKLDTLRDVVAKPHKKEATIEAITDATGLLIREKMGDTPGVREIAAKSGYSVGTIYNYFGSVGAVISHLVLKRRTSSMIRIAAVIDQHNQGDTVETLAAQVADTFFECFARIPPMVMRFAYNIAHENSEKSEAKERVCDRLVPHLLAAIERDQTGTFRRMDALEARVFVRGVVYLILFPMLEGSDLYGTPTHKRLVCDYMNKIFSEHVKLPSS